MSICNHGMRGWDCGACGPTDADIRRRWPREYARALRQQPAAAESGEEHQKSESPRGPQDVKP